MKQGKKRVRVELSRGEWMDVIEALLEWSSQLQSIRTKDNRDDARFLCPRGIACAIRIRISLHDDAETAAETAIAVELGLDYWLKTVKGLHEIQHQNDALLVHGYRIERPMDRPYRRIHKSIENQLGWGQIQRRGVTA